MHLLICLFTIFVVGSSASKECPLEVVLLLDQSQSITMAEFNDAKILMKKIASNFDLTTDDIGIVEYSAYLSNRSFRNQIFMNTTIPLGSVRTLRRFKNKVDGIKKGFWTSDTAYALTKVCKIDFMDSVNHGKQCVKRAIVLMSDGEAGDDDYAPTARQSLEGSLDVFLVGVGLGDVDMERFDIYGTGEKYEFNSYGVADLAKNIADAIKAK